MILCIELLSHFYSLDLKDCLNLIGFSENIIRERKEGYFKTTFVFSFWLIKNVFVFVFTNILDSGHNNDPTSFVFYRKCVVIFSGDLPLSQSCHNL